MTNINRLPKEKIEKLRKNFHTSVRRGNEKNRVFLNSMQFHFREFILGKEKRMINFISRSRRLRIGVASSIYGKIRSNECRRSESNEIISYIGNFNERKERSRLVKLAERSRIDHGSLEGFFHLCGKDEAKHAAERISTPFSGPR